MIQRCPLRVARVQSCSGLLHGCVTPAAVSVAAFSVAAAAVGGEQQGFRSSLWDGC